MVPLAQYTTHLKWKDRWLITHWSHDRQAQCSRDNKARQFVAGHSKSSINHPSRERFTLYIVGKRVSDVVDPAQLVCFNWNHLEIQLRNDLRPFVRLVTIINSNTMFDLYYSSLLTRRRLLQPRDGNKKSERSSEGDGNAHFKCLQTSFASFCFSYE